MTQPSPVIAAQAPAPPKSWLARRWKLLVGVLIGLMLLGIAAIFGIVSLVMASIKSSDAATEAMAKARSNPAVVQSLGTPIKEGWLVSGSINVSGGSGEADLALPISGPKGKGTVYVSARKIAGVWNYGVMQVAIDHSGQRIDLLAASPGSQPAAAPAAVAAPGSAAPQVMAQMGTDHTADYQIVGATTEFFTDTPVIHCVWSTQGADPSTPVKSVWIAEDVGNAAPPNYELAERAITGANEGSFTLSSPQNGWPPGKYRLDIYIGDQLAKQVPFTIKQK
jgi:Cytochrome oxidase complex assembly protein 1